MAKGPDGPRWCCARLKVAAGPRSSQALANNARLMQLALATQECGPMVKRASSAIYAALLAIGSSGPALAQDAAETAVILSGTGQSAGASSRSLGASVSAGIGNAANEIRASQMAATAEGQQSGAYAADGRRRNTAYEAYTIAGNVDMLAGTDAPTYRTSNGTSIRASGRFNPAAGTSCAANCPAEPVRRKAAP